MATRKEQNELWDAVSIIHNYYEDLFRPVAAAFSLTTGQLRVLHTLHRFGSLTVGDLALAVGMARTNMSSLCKKLCKQGFLLRHRGKDGDERQVLVELTPEGESAARQAEGRLDSASSVLLEADLSEFLDKLSELSQRLSPQGEQMLRLWGRCGSGMEAALAAGKKLREATRALFGDRQKKEI